MKFASFPGNVCKNSKPKKSHGLSHFSLDSLNVDIKGESPWTSISPVSPSRLHAALLVGAALMVFRIGPVF